MIGRATYLVGRSGRVAVLLFALAPSVAPAFADPAKPPAADPSIGHVEVTLDLPKDKPYVGEMIMLRMRSFVRAFITLDTVRQPTLTNFDSQQLGRDIPISATIDGFNVAGIERHIAIFPQQSGRLIIEPFVRHVTIDDGNGTRSEADFASKKLFVDVQNHNGVAAPGTWWLPVKSLTLTDNWSIPPDEIKPGTLSRRTVTVTAVGMTADRLPPPPKMLAPGIITFRGPAQRETTITDDGPVARATYQWDIRPVSASPAKLPAIHIPWFDTSERRMRDVAIADIWVAYVGTLVHTAHEQAKTWSQTYLSAGPVTAGVIGFAWTASVAGLLLTRRRSVRGVVRRRGRLLRALRRAARFHDEVRFRAVLVDLSRIDAARWAAVAQEPLVAERLRAFDAARFGREGGVAPDLNALAADITRLTAAHDQNDGPDGDALPSLDGTFEPVVAWSSRLRRHFA